MQGSLVSQPRLDLDTGAARPDWRLDEHTREVGRRGIAEARATLRAVRPRTGGVGPGAARAA